MCASLELFGHHLEPSKGHWHLCQQPIWGALPSKVSAALPCCNTQWHKLLNLLLHWKLHQYADIYEVSTCTAKQHIDRLNDTSCCSRTGKSWPRPLTCTRGYHGECHQRRSRSGGQISWCCCLLYIMCHRQPCTL